MSASAGALFYVDGRAEMLLILAAATQHAENGSAEEVAPSALVTA
jgi:hypothetical protein